MTRQAEGFNGCPKKPNPPLGASNLAWLFGTSPARATPGLNNKNFPGRFYHRHASPNRNDLSSGESGMNLKQLRFFVQIVHSDLNMSRAAQVLCTSQAAVSKQILLLEDELGVQLFLRKGKRFICVTSAGKDVLAISKRMIKEVENIRAATMDHKDQSVGKLIIAATTTQ
ncbi:MAG: LysR family transcriptional regulator, partial [Candidimonas sp.]